MHLNLSTFQVFKDLSVPYEGFSSQCWSPICHALIQDSNQTGQVVVLCDSTLGVSWNFLKYWKRFSKMHCLTDIPFKQTNRILYSSACRVPTLLKYWNLRLFPRLKWQFLVLKNKELHKEENEMAFIFMRLPSVDTH